MIGIGADTNTSGFTLYCLLLTGWMKSTVIMLISRNIEIATCQYIPRIEAVSSFQNVFSFSFNDRRKIRDSYDINSKWNYFQVLKNVAFLLLPFFWIEFDAQRKVIFSWYSCKIQSMAPKWLLPGALRSEYT